jgi:hypothetical protein
MNKKLIDLTGERFGKLIVLSRDTVEIGAKGNKKGQFRWKCKCDCGTVCLVRSGELRYGSTRSCGCYRRERNFKHGHTTHFSKSKTNQVWNAMVQRCTNKKAKSYNRYGGRGIVVCTRWLVFENFLSDMGEAPEGLTIERIDNDGPYAKWNCCWADWDTQNNNRRRTKSVNVRAHHNKFRADVSIKGERFYLGLFETSKKAIRAISLRLRSKGLV